MPDVSYSPVVDILTCRAHVVDAWPPSDQKAPFWRLYWNPKAGAEVISGGERFSLAPQSVLVIPPNTSYTVETARPVMHLYVHYDAGAPYDHAEAYPFALQPGNDVRAVLREVLEIAPDVPVDTLTARMRLLGLFLATWAMSRTPPERLGVAVRPSRLAAVLERMASRPGEALDNETLAGLAGISPSAFARMFREAMGCPPQAWRTRRRIEHACRLLAHTEKTIEEIAAACGYCDRYQFSRIFKRLRGCGPAAFRRQQTAHLQPRP